MLHLCNSGTDLLMMQINVTFIHFLCVYFFNVHCVLMSCLLQVIQDMWKIL